MVQLKSNPGGVDDPSSRDPRKSKGRSDQVAPREIASLIHRETSGIWGLGGLAKGNQEAFFFCIFSLFLSTNPLIFSRIVLNSIGLDLENSSKSSKAASQSFGDWWARSFNDSCLGGTRIDRGKTRRQHETRKHGNYSLRKVGDASKQDRESSTSLCRSCAGIHKQSATPQLTGQSQELTKATEN